LEFLVVCNFYLFLYCKVTNFLFNNQIISLFFLFFCKKNVFFFVFEAKFGCFGQKKPPIFANGWLQENKTLISTFMAM